MSISKFISVGIIPKVNLGKDDCYFRKTHPCDPFIDKAAIEKDLINHEQTAELSNLDKYLIEEVTVEEDGQQVTKTRPARCNSQGAVFVVQVGCLQS